MEDDAKVGSHPTSNVPAHILVPHSKQKNHLLQDDCNICATNTMVERDNSSIYCKNCDCELLLK
jgi:hypothetical protein